MKIYLREDQEKVQVTLTILFNRESVDKLVPIVLEKQKERLSRITTTCQQIKRITAKAHHHRPLAVNMAGIILI